MSFLVHRPDLEPGFRLVRAEGADRRIGYSLEPRTATTRSEAPAR